MKDAKRLPILLMIIAILPFNSWAMEDDPYFPIKKPQPEKTDTSSSSENEENQPQIASAVSNSAPVTPLVPRRKSSLLSNLKKSSPSDIRSSMSPQNKQDAAQKWKQLKELQLQPLPLKILQINTDNSLWIDFKNQLYNQSLMPDAPIKLSYGVDQRGDQSFIFTETIHDGNSIEYIVIPDGHVVKLQMSLFLKGESNPVMTLQIGWAPENKNNIEILKFDIDDSIYLNQGLKSDLMNSLKRKLKQLGQKKLVIHFNMTWRHVFIDQLFFKELSFDGKTAEVYAVFDLDKFKQ